MRQNANQIPVLYYANFIDFQSEKKMSFWIMD